MRARAVTQLSRANVCCGAELGLPAFFPSPSLLGGGPLENGGFLRRVARATLAVRDFQRTPPARLFTGAAGGY